jgi:hypothetical protein
VFEQQSELLLVIAPDQLARGPALDTIIGALAACVHDTEINSSASE